MSPVATLPSISELEMAWDPSQATEQRKIVKLSYSVKVITPMVGGGVAKGSIDRSLPFRTRSLRGRLRHWWRIGKRIELDAAGGAGNASNPEAAKHLREREFEIWGGEIGGKPNASKVGLRITPVGEPTPMAHTSIHNDLKYAYFPVIENREDVFAKGAKFKLDVFCEPALQSEVEMAIRYWATFGGVGARTSRGAGAVLVKAKGNDEKSDRLCSVLNGRDLLQAGGPGIRVGKYIRIWLVQHNDASSAHEFGIRKLKELRQGKDIGRNGRYGRSHWPEADSMKRIAGEWQQHHDPVAVGPEEKLLAPRAVFGMPLNMSFKATDDHEKRDGKGPVKRDTKGQDPGVRALMPVEGGSNRMASPLILRPVAIEELDTKGLAKIVFYSMAACVNSNALESKVTGRGRPTEAVARPMDPGSSSKGEKLSVQLPLAFPNSDLERLRKGEAGSPFVPAINALQMFINLFVSR